MTTHAIFETHLHFQYISHPKHIKGVFDSLYSGITINRIVSENCFLRHTCSINLSREKERKQGNGRYQFPLLQPVAELQKNMFIIRQ